MSERENFLERWSRKKVEGQRENADPPESAAPDATEPQPDDAAPAGGTQPLPSPNVSKPEFDLTSLPSLDSITAATDIRAFLAPGVPQELSRAALRRAWTADPAVRDFVGLAENQWDFANPAAVPGFGDIPAGTDLTKMIAEIFGETRRPSEDATPVETASADATAQVPPATEESAAEAPPHDSVESQAVDSIRSIGPSDAKYAEEPAQIVRHNKISASQQNLAQESPAASTARRSHGGALPKT